MTEDHQFKQAVIVRRDLGMGRGKIVVQCCHGSVIASEEARTRFREWWQAWMRDGQTKIALKVKDLETVLKLMREARVANLPLCLVRDKGLTQVEPGTVTCLAIGPAPSRLLDPLTGHLALL